MIRKDWGDAFQELDDMEFNYEIFTRSSTTLDAISNNGWEAAGKFDYEGMKKFISDKQSIYKTKYTPKIMGNNNILYVFKSDNIREKYFQIKVKRGEPL